jgi:fructokinase
MPDVLVVGEALVEFVSTEAGATLREARAFEKGIGGAAARLAIGLARRGVSSGFVGRVGDDPFGHFLADGLAAEGVDVSQLGFERRARTGLVFTSPTGQGRRDPLFFRHPSAGMFLSPGHVNPAYIKTARAIVYNPSGLMGEPSRSAVFKALAIAQGAGLWRVYHVNLHLSLWESESEARYGLGLGLERAEVVALNRDELEFLSGMRDVAEGTQALWRDPMRMLVVALGAEGCAYRTAAGFRQVPGYPVEAMDSDSMHVTFLAGFLAKLVRRDFAFNQEDIFAYCSTSQALP